jgi:hypothetical protein
MKMSKDRKSDQALMAEARETIDVVSRLSKLPKPFGEKELAKLYDAFAASVDETDATILARKRAVAKKHSAKSMLYGQLVQLRALVRGLYGADSQEYAALGGTRASTRKRPPRKPLEPAPTPAPVQ